MLYETYKLGKMKRTPVRRLYTREELEALELPRLREICRAEGIKPPTMETFHQKEEMVNLLYRYLGAVEKADYLVIRQINACFWNMPSCRMEESSRE